MTRCEILKHTFSFERYFNGFLSFFKKVLLEMSPGLAVDKQVLSSRDLLTHSADPSVYPSSDIIRSLIDAESFATAKVGQETVLDLLCFGSSEVKRTRTFSPFFS